LRSRWQIETIAEYSAPVRIIAFLVLLLAIWLPGAAVVYLSIASTGDVNEPVRANQLTIGAMGLLTVEFLFYLRWWNRRVYRRTSTYSFYGLTAEGRNWQEFFQGFITGVFSCGMLFVIQGWLGWLTWHAPKMPWWQLILEGIVSSVGVGFAEELFFRGWLLAELDRDYKPKFAGLVNLTLFAASHFLKSIEAMLAGLPQFPGLMLFGAICLTGKRLCNNRLGMSIGLHAGMVWVIYQVSVGKLVTHTGVVSDWITGIYGAPNAGLLGIIGMSILIATLPLSVKSKI
jgi:uncharacterized protein